MQCGTVDEHEGVLHFGCAKTGLMILGISMRDGVKCGAAKVDKQINKRDESADWCLTLWAAHIAINFVS